MVRTTAARKQSVEMMRIDRSIGRNDCKITRLRWQSYGAICYAFPLAKPI